MVNSPMFKRWSFIGVMVGAHQKKGYSNTYLIGYLDVCGSLTLPETHIAPKNGWLEYEFPFGMAYFQVRTVSFREGNGFFKPVWQNGN